MIKTVLFDVDGVLLSEERYFDASALTVWEMLFSSNYLGLDSEKFKIAYNEDDIADIRTRVFHKDEVLKLMKSYGFNANWDMIYLTFAYQLIRLLAQIKEVEQPQIINWLEKDIDQQTLLDMQQTFSKYRLDIDFETLIEDFQKANTANPNLFLHLNDLAEQKLGVKTATFKRESPLWDIGEHASQEWYVGDDNILASTGKPSIQQGKQGFLKDEKTLGKPEDIGWLFQALKKAGVTIGIGTGRPELETIGPFRHLGWLDYFESNDIATADDVLNAEKDYPSYIPLAKPHPFTYISALLGRDTPTLESINYPVPIENGDEVLVVGDSLADLLAAEQMGCRFAAVLTGLSGKEARAEFAAHQAEFILDSVMDVKELVLSLAK